ncbi:MAG: YrbL family protein [Henriciella sp.]
MIDLSNTKAFAQGGNRVCYQHPDDENICLKITHAGLPQKLKSQAPWYKKYRDESRFDDNIREHAAYRQRAILQNDPVIWDHLAKWYGFHETSLGMASATELILNDGEIAETLETYLYKNGKDHEITEAIRQFEAWLKDTLLLTKNIIPHNLVVKKQDDGLQLKIIDGLGCASFIPLPEMNRRFARQYVNRRIELMHARIRWDLSGRQGDWK